MRKILSLLLMLCLLQHLSYSQDQNKIDSLQNELKKVEATRTKLGDKAPVLFDTAKANILNQISKAYSDSNAEKAMDYARQALALSGQIGYKKGMGNSYLRMGLINQIQGNYLQAVDFYKKALKIREEWLEQAKRTGDTAELPEINDGVATCYNNMENDFLALGNYPEALKYCFAALKLQEEQGNKRLIGDCYLKIGNIYVTQTNYPEALKNFSTSLEMAKETDWKFGMTNAYGSMGYVYCLQGNYPEALKYQYMSLKIAEEMKDTSGIAGSYINIGFVYQSQHNYTEALKNYFIYLKMTEELKDQSAISGAYAQIGETYKDQGNRTEAYRYINKGLSFAKETGSLGSIEQGYSDLAALDSAKGDYQQSLEHYKLYITARDSEFNQANTKKIVQSQMQYDFDKKESLAKAEQEKKDALALKELQKQKLVRNGFVGGFAVVLLFAGVFFTQRNKITKGKKRSDELLLNILPSEVAEELKTKGSAAAKQFDDVTVMFTDFKNFTQISEKLSPDELVAEIHTCFKAFDNIITKYNIEKIKTMGDSYMCAGGLPVANKTNATDVVSAALEIQKFMQQHLEQRKNEGKEPFEMRIGIHTGPVVAGIVGVKKFAYDIWGDTVNIASRMESSGEAGKVNVSGSTYELIKDKFNCTLRGKVQAKNKGEIDMYFVE